MQGRIFGGEVRRSVVFCFFRFSAGAARHIKNLYPLFIIIKVNKLTVECTQRGLRLFCVNLMRNANGGLAALWRFAVVPTCDHRQRRLIVKACVSLWLAHLSELSALRPLSSHRRRSVCPHRTLFNTSCVCWAGAWDRGRASRSLFDHHSTPSETRAIQ